MSAKQVNTVTLTPSAGAGRTPCPCRELETQTEHTDQGVAVPRNGPDFIGTKRKERNSEELPERNRNVRYRYAGDRYTDRNANTSVTRNSTR